MDDYMGWTDEDYQNFLREKEAGAQIEVQQLMEKLNQDNLLSTDKIADIDSKIKSCQSKVSYNGDYDNWVKTHLPKRLEDMIDSDH